MQDDLISRQAVLEMAYDMSEIDGEHFTEPHMVVDVAYIQKLKPQERTGHWILTSDDDYEYCTCSECGYQNGENWMIGSYIKFCQECGAKMEVEQND